MDIWTFIENRIFSDNHYVHDYQSLNKLFLYITISGRKDPRQKKQLF